MGWVADKAAEIAGTIRGRDYLKAEYRMTFTADGPGRWLAACPLCSGTESFVLLEGGDRWCDWRCFMCPPRADGRVTNRGDLVDLVMSREKLDKADAIRHILARAEPYRLPALEAAQVLKRASEYFRFTRFRQTRVLDYLKGRGIEADLLDEMFHLGGNDVEVEQLLPYIEVATGNSCSRNILRMPGVALLAGRRLNLRPAVTAPLYVEDGGLVGLQLRRCSETEKTRYIIRGLRPDLRQWYLYGLHSREVRQAIEDQDAVIVAEGVFDAWACYQRGVHHVVATLDKGMTQRQFDRLLEFGASNLVLGFANEEEQKLVVAMAEGETAGLVPQVMLLDLFSPADAGKRRQGGLDRVLNKAPQTAVEDMLRSSEMDVEADQRAHGLVAAKRASALFKQELEAGHYFVVPRKNLEAAIGKGPDNKTPTKALVALLGRHRKQNKRTSNVPYLKVPHDFVDGGLHKRLGVSLRLLMYLHTKTTGVNRPVSIKNGTIIRDLEIAASGLKPQKRKLEGQGLLVVVPPGTRARRAWQHYPFFIPAEDN